MSSRTIEAICEISVGVDELRVKLEVLDDKKSGDIDREGYVTQVHGYSNYGEALGRSMTGKCLARENCYYGKQCSGEPRYIEEPSGNIIVVTHSREIRRSYITGIPLPLRYR